MNCPVCKYPNPQGATHCGMCYEVFNRSAAQAYLHAVKRDRQMTEEPVTPKIYSPPGEGTLQKWGALLKKVDWEKVTAAARSALRRSQKGFLIAGAMVLVWMLASFLLDPSHWYHGFGKTMAYAFSSEAPPQYLVTMTETIKSWSERQGRLDTPLEEFKIEEFGNVLVTPIKKDQKSENAARVQAREWIQILHGARGVTSHAISLSHPSLADARIILDKKGRLLERRYALSPRLGKGLPFLTPRFPKSRLRRGQTWTEQVEWIDFYNDWKIYWAGTLHWTAGDLEPCGNDTCLRLTYQADLRPQLKAAPAWAAHAVKAARSQAIAEGSALFDAGHKRLVSNTFTYAGLLYVPLADLGRIPWELRIGRRVKGTAGEIAIRFESKIDIRKN